MDNEILISVNELGRFYGQHQAINNVSFNVHRGEILGFLGPNGAGKSTTMQIISGVLAASHGSVTIAGQDIQTDGRTAKQHIGFLPEQPPLYTDLTVDEYLHYAAHLRNINKSEINDAIKVSKIRCGLEDVGQRLIQNLSKGYKQRVGIAQAIIHSPAVIILDEPTSGLDPIQIREIRELMRELGEDHSVILSTHILSEVQSLCDRVLIINQGNIVLDQHLRELQQRGNNPQQLELGLRQAPAVDVLLAIAGVNAVEQTEQGTLLLDLDPNTNVTNTLLEKSVQEQWGLYLLNPGDASLESIFMQLTYGELQTNTETEAKPDA